MTFYKRTAKKPNEYDGDNDERLGGEEAHVPSFKK